MQPLKVPSQTQEGRSQGGVTESRPYPSGDWLGCLAESPLQKLSCGLVDQWRTAPEKLVRTRDWKEERDQQ